MQNATTAAIITLLLSLPALDGVKSPTRTHAVGAAFTAGGQQEAQPDRRSDTAGQDESRSSGQNSGEIREAVAVLTSIGDSGVTGTIYFKRVGDKIDITGKVTGLTPGKHGFHVHTYGDLTDMMEGKSAGAHYNPGNVPHGRPGDKNRHVGDLGNIDANEAGVATINMQDSVIALNGPHSIIGRSVVVHAEEDRFTQPQGNAGPRIAVGVIGIANPADAGGK